MMIRTALKTLAAAALACPTLAGADVLVSDDFSGQGTDPLNGTSPDVNVFSSATWNANSIFNADGSVDGSGANTDRGAFLDLGAGFEFLANETYTLTFSVSNVATSALFVGFNNDTPPSATGGTGQLVGDNFSIRARNFGIPDAYLWKEVGGTVTQTNTDLAFSGTGTYVITIETNNLTNATISAGVASDSFDVSDIRQIYLAFEDNGANGANFDSFVFEGPVPEPGSLAMLGLGGLLIARRRRG